MKTFDYHRNRARGCAPHNTGLRPTKKYLTMAIVWALSTSIANANLALQGIETISVKGQVNSLLMATDIDLQKASPPDLRSQLTQLPGINVNGNGQLSGIVQYRGLYSDRVRVTVDDVIISGAGPNSMDSPLSHVIGNMSQRVTLYHAIAPVSAGAETLGGAIDISDISPMLSGSRNFEFSGALSASAYSNDGLSAMALLNAVNDTTYFSLTADVQDGDNLESGSGLNIANTYYNRNGIKLSGGYEKNAHKLSGFVNKRTTNESGTPALAMDIEFVDALVMGLRYEYVINDQWRMYTKLAGNNNEHDMNNYSQRTAPMPAMQRLNSVDSQGRSASLGFTQEYANWQNEYGFDINTAKHNSFITNPNVSMFFVDSFNDVNRDVYSVFGQWRKNINTQRGWLNWQFGTRATRVSATANTIDSNMAAMNPNVAALRDTFNASDRSLDFSLVDAVISSSYSINHSLQVQVSAGIKQKAPSYSQLYTWFPLGISAGLADGRNYLGNLELKKESAAKLDLGLRVSGNDWVFMPNVFYTDVSDYIMGITSTNISANMLANMNNIQVPLVWQNQDAMLP